MVGVVIATHGRLADELIACAEAIVGKLPRMRAVTLSAGVPIDEARDALAVAIHEVDEGDGVLVLTDMLGGTPANMALGFLEDRVDVVTGVNLPMLLKLSTCRSAGASLADLSRLIAAYGQKNITLASELLRAKVRSGGEDP